MASGPWRSMFLASHMHPREFNHMPGMGSKMTGGIHFSLGEDKAAFAASGCQDGTVPFT